MLVLGIGLAVMLWPRGEGEIHAAAAPVAEVRNALEEAEAVAQAFLAGSGMEERLRWVRNAEEVRNRVADYPSAARSEVGEIEKMIGHGGGTTAFAVALPSGEVRLLEVVDTPEGPRVDWDAYARHGTATWEDLWSGKAERAVVRVFCEPSTEYPEPFDDWERWTTFRLSSPDMGRVALGFAEIGTVREEMMKKVVLGSARYRQRFVLEVVRHEGAGEPLFEIVKCRAVGWIEGERPVEEIWAERPEAD
ncbi:hypothetical protein MLD59_06725 [Verrucomicrobiaceae bacterium E54]|nr:hypothetical protein [Verrucomicrobiaceae bacterium E54]